MRIILTEECEKIILTIKEEKKVIEINASKYASRNSNNINNHSKSKSLGPFLDISKSNNEIQRKIKSIDQHKEIRIHQNKLTISQ